MTTEPLEPSDPLLSDVDTALTTAGLTVRAATQCTQCGQVDADPKSHILGDDGGRHLDCLSVAQRQMVAESSPAAAAAIAAAFDGVHGDDLVALIQTATTEEN